MKNRSYNPTISDVSDDRYSYLREYDNNPLVSLLRTFHTMDLGNAYMVIEMLTPLDLNKVKVGDDVYFGNSKGIVTGVIKDEEDDDRVVGLNILRQLNYLTKAQRLNPTASGYNAQGTGVSMNYYLYQADEIRKDKNGDGAMFLYPGSFYIVRRRDPSDVSSMPSIWSSIQAYQNKFDENAI